jgi:hypothetical protein
MPKTLDEILAACKSLRRIEGQAEVMKFLQAREEDRKKSGCTDVAEVCTVPKTDRVFLKRNIPTGFRQKRLQIDTAQARALAEKSGVVWEVGFETPTLRVLGWRMSDERVDRHGDIVRQNFDWGDYDKNPVFLNCHDWSSEGLIGNVIQHETVLVNEQNYSGPATNGICLFSPDGVDEEADRMFRLAKANIARAGSIGFFPLIIVYVQDEAERTELGLGRWGVIYEKSAVAEFSICPIPANQGALQNGLLKLASHKLLKPTEASAIKTFFAKGKNLFQEGGLDELNKAVDDTFKKAFPGTKSEPESAPKTPPESRSADERLAAVEANQLKLVGTFETMTKNLTLLTALVSGTMSAIKGGMEDLFENQQVLTTENGMSGTPTDKGTEVKDDLDDLEDLVLDEGIEDEDDLDTDDDSDESDSDDDGDELDVELEDIDGDSDESDSDDDLDD